MPSARQPIQGFMLGEKLPARSATDKKPKRRLVVNLESELLLDELAERLMGHTREELAGVRRQVSALVQEIHMLGLKLCGGNPRPFSVKHDLQPFVLPDDDIPF